LKPNRTPISFFSLLFFLFATIAFQALSIYPECFNNCATAKNDSIDSKYYLVEGTDFEYDKHAPWGEGIINERIINNYMELQQRILEDGLGPL